MDRRASATAREAAHGQELLRRKYGWLKIVGDFFSRLRGRTQTVIAIQHRRKSCGKFRSTAPPQPKDD